MDVRLCLGWRDVPDWLKKAAVVEPADPFQRVVFDGFEVPQWTASVRPVSSREELSESVTCRLTTTSAPTAGCSEKGGRGAQLFP